MNKLERWALRKGSIYMIKKLLDVTKYANWLTAIAQLIGIVTGLFPAKPWTPALLAVQTIIQGLMTSIGGVGHRLSFGEAQAPADRTAEEVHASAVETKAALVAAAPAGANIIVPSVQIVTAQGTKGPTP
jgi:hypothetical protein